MEIESPVAGVNGPAWAAVLGAGIGCATLGLLVDLAEAFRIVSRGLNFYGPTGDLSGKTIVTIVVWIGAWALLHARWKNRAVRSPRAVFAVSLFLVLLGFLAVFPPFFGMIEAR